MHVFLSYLSWLPVITVWLHAPGASAQQYGGALFDSTEFYRQQLHGKQSQKPAKKPLLTPSPAKKKPADTRAIFTYSIENDAMAGEDDGYTNGFRIARLSPETDVSVFGFDGKKRINVMVGQSIFAPGNLSAKTPDPDDRPYAGWLYAGAGIVSDSDSYVDEAHILVGVVGPSSGAEETQKFVHEFTTSTTPRGWDSQLQDELGVVLSAQRTWRDVYDVHPLGLHIDMTPSVGASLGNVHTNAAAGVTFRLGNDLPADYGPPMIRPSLPGSDFFMPSRSFGWYIFSGAEARAVARNIFLDGSTFGDSPSVDKEPFIVGLQSGIVFTYRRVRLGYTHVMRTREFATQERKEAFGAVTFSYRY